MKRILTLAMAAALLASLTGCGTSAAASDTDYIYGQIDTISGNDIVLLLADYNENADSGDTDSEEKTDSGDSRREKPEGFDKSKFSGEMPEGFDKSKFGGSRSRSGGNSRYTLTGEQEEIRVPVGTTVTTALGVETDFEVLKSGDMVKCSIAKDSDGNDVITAIWILDN